MCGTIRHPDASDFWSMKIAALFHDPPLKPWVKQHQDFAAKYLPNPVKNLKVGDVKVEELVRRHHDAKGLVKALAFADWCSSSVERPIAELVRSPKEVGFIHPLSGLELGETGVSVMHSMSELQARDIAERMMNTLSECIKRFNLLGKVDVEHVKATYLMLWRCLEGAWWKAVSEVLEDEAKKLIPPPADTRTPTHTVFDHVESTSALAPCSSSGDALNAALVSFDVGGIQPFISASRKTSDLWAASWLVSLLGWGALRRVCEVLGPDAVVFPYLKGIPFADVWIIRKTIRSSESKAKFSDVLKYILEVEGLSEEEWYEKFMLSLIPPTAALIVPKHLVDEVKRCLIEGLEECWRNLVSIAWKYLNEKFECSVAEVRERWGRQTKEPPIGPVRVVHTEFPEKSEEIENFLKEHGWLIPKKLYETLEKLVQKLWELKKNGELRYPSRPSIVYGAIFAINAAKMASLTREFEVPIEPSPLEERGAEIKERCNMCGVRNPLFLRKEEWRRLAEEDIIEWDYRHDRGEYLCSICLIKRLLSRKKIIEKVLEEIVGLPRNIAGNVAKRGGFPSTSDFAAALFKHTLAELIVECRISQTELEELNKKAQKLVNKIREFAGKSGIRTLVSRQPPMIERDIKEIERRYGKSAEPLLALLRFMGEFLDPDTYYRLLQRRRLSEDEKRALRNTAKRIGKDLKEIVEVVKKCVRRYRPKEGGTPLRIKPLSIGVSDTFAIVSSDGDYMGEWIQGLRLPPLKLSVPPSLRDDFEYRYQSLSGMHKILSPATHIAISRSLLWYAKEVVPRVVEE
ncbi:type III-B CRISPR-associated protein Cas10/Cmr2, partial [Candidatus Bathyarchaeota archaeon]